MVVLSKKTIATQLAADVVFPRERAIHFGDFGKKGEKGEKGEKGNRGYANHASWGVNGELSNPNPTGWHSNGEVGFSFASFGDKGDKGEKGEGNRGYKGFKVGYKDKDRDKDPGDRNFRMAYKDKDKDRDDHKMTYKDKDKDRHKMHHKKPPVVVTVVTPELATQNPEATWVHHRRLYDGWAGDYYGNLVGPVVPAGTSGASGASL